MNGQRGRYRSSLAEPLQAFQLVQRTSELSVDRALKAKNSVEVLAARHNVSRHRILGNIVLPLLRTRFKQIDQVLHPSATDLRRILVSS
jgi:hypothetical protein